MAFESLTDKLQNVFKNLRGKGRLTEEAVSYTHLDVYKRQTLDHVNTIADGTAVKTPGSIIFPYIQQNIDEIITLSLIHI